MNLNKRILAIFMFIMIFISSVNIVWALNDKNESLLAEGVYVIKSALNESYVLNIEGESNENGGNLQLYNNLNSYKQRLYIKSLGNDTYTISVIYDDKYLDVCASGKENGTNVAQWEYYGSDNQQWIIKSAGNGYYNIISKCNGLYLDIPHSEAKNGTNIHVWEKNNAKNQLFKFEKVEEKEIGKKTLDNGTYMIKSALNEKYVFDIEGASKINGGNLELWENLKNGNQRFIINYLNNGTYSISSEHSKKYLDVERSSWKLGTNVAQWQENGYENQQWIIKDAGNGYYNIISNCNGLYLDIPYSKAKNGANVQLWEKNNAKNQLFKFEEVKIETNGSKSIESDTYYIKCISNNKVLDVNGSSMDDGGNVGFWTNGQTANQKFSVKYLENGYYTISAQHSDKSIRISNNSLNVEQSYRNEFDNEQWIIKKTGDGYYNIISKINGRYLMQSATGNAESGENNNSANQKFIFEKPTPMKGSKTIENGTYIVKSAINNNSVFDVPGSSIKDNQVINIWENNSTANQKFEVTYIGEGYYTLIAQHSGKAIEVANGSKKLYTNIQQNAKDTTDKQKWIIKDAGDGYYNIISKCSEFCIGIDENSLQMQNINNSNTQRFKFEKPIPLKGTQTIADGKYVIASELNRKLVFDVPQSSNKDGEKLELWTNGLTSNQKFNVKYIGEGYYTLTAEHSGKVLEVANNDKKLNAAIVQNTYKASENQQWIIKDVGNGYYNIISKCSELAIEVVNSNASNGTKLQTFTVNNTTAQKFRFCNPNSYIDLDEKKYPSYIESLEKLQSAHPDWNFEFLYTGLSFWEAVAGEAKVHSRNLVPKSYSGEWICSICGTKLYDSGLYCASEVAIAYYLDPRNFLNEENIFQFLDVNEYDSSSCTLQGIQQKIDGTFLKDYANDINNACKNKNVNPYYIISRVLQEQGSKGSKIGTGMDGGDGKTYYNPFNIGASGNGYTQIYNNALAKAKANGWDTMQKALEGGIDFCKKNWLDNYQNTLYQNKFDIDSRNGTRLYEHQYMQNLLGAYSEAKTLRSMYYKTGKIDSKFTFIIPVYENMDTIISQVPSTGSEMYPMNVQITGNNVRFRKEANTDSQIITTFSSGTILLSIQRGINSNWQKVITTDGTIGYVSGEYLKQVNDITTCNYSKVVTTKDGIGCKVRYGPGLNAPQMTSLPDGTIVTVIDDSTYKDIDGYDWYRITLSNGKQGFMPGKYLN